MWSGRKDGGLAMGKAFAWLLLILLSIAAAWQWSAVLAGDPKPWPRMGETLPGGSGIEDPDWDEDAYCPPPPPPDE